MAAWKTRVSFFGKDNPEGMKEGRKERIRDMFHFRDDNGKVNYPDKYLSLPSASSTWNELH